MKSKIVSLSALCLLLSICITILGGCSTEKAKDEEYLYNWLLENGELVNGTKLVYEEKLEDGKVFALHYDTGYTHELFVTYTTNYDGYELKVRLPLLTDSSKVITWLTLVNNDDFTHGLEYYHNPDTFTKKTPIEHGDGFGDTIVINEATKEEREEWEKMYKLCAELAHESLCSLIDWLNESLCPKAKLELSDLGYLKY